MVLEIEVFGLQTIYGIALGEEEGAVLNASPMPHLPLMFVQCI